MSREQLKRLEVVAPTRGIKIRVIAVRAPAALEGAFEQAQRTAKAVLVLADQNMLDQRRVAALAAQHRLPDMHSLREYVDAGGLMAYAPDVRDMYRRAADYVDKILRGAKPADLPIEEPTILVFAVGTHPFSSAIQRPVTGNFRSILG